MAINNEDVDALATGAGDVRTSSGDKVGKIGQVYLDDDSGRPSWVTVKTGLFGTQESFVPLPGAELDGVDVVVPYDKDTIKGAPRVDSDGSLSPQEEKLLYSYYFDAPTLAAAEQHVGSQDDGSDRAGRRERFDDDGVEDRDRDHGDNVVRSRDGGDTDDRHGRGGDDDPVHDRDTDNEDGGGAVGSPRLRRYVVTEKVVPVSREEVPVEDTERR